MALLKAFACQVVLLGLYKLFLEQVVEEFLVPDELTRNCLVGFVCLLCFGIQLYTDKAGDEDDAGADENPKEKSESRGLKSAKKSESVEISATYETVGSSTSSRVSATKPQTTSREIGNEKRSPNDKQIGDLGEMSGAVPSVGKLSEATHSGIFAQFSSNMVQFDTISKVDGIEPQMTASTVQISCNQSTTTIRVLNGYSEMNACEESDEDGIEIDQFVTRQSDNKGAGQLRKEEEEQVVAMEPKDWTEQAEKFGTSEAKAIKLNGSTDMAEETQQRTTGGNEQIKTSVKEANLESECLVADGENTSSAKDPDGDTNPKMDELSERMVTNGIGEKSLNNIDNISSNIIEQIESEKSMLDEIEIGNRQDIILPTGSAEQSKDITHSSPSAQEICNSSSIHTKAKNNAENVNINNTKTTTLEKKGISSPSEQIVASTERHKATAVGDLCFAPLTIDISFIYACH